MIGRTIGAGAPNREESPPWRLSRVGFRTASTTQVGITTLETSISLRGGPGRVIANIADSSRTSIPPGGSRDEGANTQCSLVWSDWG